MPIIVLGFDPQPVRNNASTPVFSSDFLDNLIKRIPTLELFVFEATDALEIIAMSDKPEEVLHELDAILENLENVADDFKKSVFHKRGAEAITHFFQRAIGNQGCSAPNGSIQIFRNSFEWARDRHYTGPYLNRLYQKGIWLSEKVRIELSLQEEALTMELVITELAQKIFGNLKDHSALIVMGSSGCEKIVEKLSEKNIRQLYFLQLDKNGIDRICEKYQGRRITPGQLNDVLISIDLILVFDQRFEQLLTAKQLSQIMNQRNNAPLLWASLFAADEQESNLTKIYNVYHYNRTDLKSIVASNLKEHQKTARMVDKLIAKEVVDFIKWVHAAEPFRFGKIIGKSPAMQRIFDLVAQIAQTDISVLIDGESGTGKELVARAIHEHSRRAKNPFVVVNCGAMTENLLESELFGHVRGAFTGATDSKKGLFEIASQGTIFLDEIGETSPNMQVKLLRFLQEGEVRPVGSNKIITVDVRLITATNRDLERLVREGKFRQDLYYRLNVIQITIPPLRERPQDILPMVEYFKQKYSDKIHKSITGLEAEAELRLSQYRWPGNVRELENAIERTVALARGNQITLMDLPPQIVATENRFDATEVHGKDLSLQELEKSHIRKTLKQYNWDYERVTRILGIGRTTLWRKMKAYNISNSPPRANKSIHSIS